MNTQLAFIKTQDGNITLTLGAKNFSVGTSHPNYSRIVDSLKNREYDGLESMLDVPRAINTRMGSRGVTVQNGQVFFKDLPMHNTVTERILSFMAEGLPTEPLVRFLENLMANPMPMAVAELYDFLENSVDGRSQFPITEDGCFIGYKGVNDNFTDKHTGTLDNSIGNVVSIPRESVDPDRRNECSYGLHIGTLKYASEFVGSGGKVLMVKVNPADCIAVPKDYNCSKLRACKYEVIAEAQGIISTPMWPMPTEPQDDFDEDSYEEEDSYEDADEQESSYVDPFSTPIATAEELEEDVPVATAPKRAPCAYCGAKGGKAHLPGCRRPRKS